MAHATEPTSACPGWETALGRLDAAVREIVGLQPGAQPGPAWHDAVQEFAAQAAHLEVLLGKAGAALQASTDTVDSRSIALLESELASKNQLLSHAHQQVKKWQQVCQELEQQHQDSIYAGIS